MNLQDIKDLIHNEIVKYIDPNIYFYRLSGYNKNIYGESTSRTYEDPIQLVAIIISHTDTDMMEEIGRINSDEMIVNIPMKEVDDKLTEIPTLNDKIIYNNRAYSIINIWNTAVVYSGSSMIRIMLKENPDLE